MAYNTPETVADYLARFQMEITHRGKGTFTPDHVKYSLTIASGGKDFFTTFESNPHVHGEPTITQVFGALASDAMVVRDYGMDEFVDDARPTPLWSSTIPRRMPHASRAVSSSLATT